MASTFRILDRQMCIGVAQLMCIGSAPMKSIVGTSTRFLILDPNSLFNSDCFGVEELSCSTLWNTISRLSLSS